MNLKIKVSNQIELNLSGLSIQLQREIKKDLTLKNPEYTQALKSRRPTIGKIENLELFRAEGDILILPRGYGSKLKSHLRNHQIIYQWEDSRLLLPLVNFESNIELRDYQEAAVESLIRYKQGGIVAGCGAGKTMIGLETLARIGQPALWVTHTNELLEQVVSRSCSVFNMKREEIGIIGSGHFTIGNRLTVALVQTLAKSDFEEIKRRFGAVFVDEAHHLAARTFFHPIGQFPAVYRLWASATPIRSDGLTDMVFAAGGPILHTVDQSKVPTIIPRLEVIETNYSYHNEDYVQLIGDLIKNKERNEFIVEKIFEESKGNYSLILSDRVEHLEILQKMLKQKMPDLVIEILMGSMSKKSRISVMQRVQSGEVDILLGTQLAREGLDITHLNRLFLCTPKRAAGAVEQEVGRIMRPCLGKMEAVVYDFWDSKSPILKAQFWKRREVYRKIGMDWNLGGERRYAK